MTGPRYPIPASTPTSIETIEIALTSNGTHNVYLLNGVQHMTNFSTSLLDDIAAGQNTFAPSEMVHNGGANGTGATRFVFRNLDAGGFHPMHLHGHNFQVLSVGFGEWNGSIVRGANPARRDTQVMPPALGGPSHLVVQWERDNPGVWPLHCHLAWHLSAGLYLNVLEGREVLADGSGYRDIGRQVGETCGPWRIWERRNVVDTIDDGV